MFFFFVTNEHIKDAMSGLNFFCLQPCAGYGAMFTIQTMNPMGTLRPLYLQLHSVLRYPTKIIKPTLSSQLHSPPILQHQLYTSIE